MRVDVICVCLYIYTWGWSFYRAAAWPLHEIAIIQYGMVYGIQKGGRWKGVHCAMVVQWYCNSVGFATWGGGEG